MMKRLRNRLRLYQTRFSFGSTAAILTNLGLITGLDTLSNARMSIIGSIFVIAVADNISDSFGIHIYQESECLSPKEIWISTITNFLSRLAVSLIFIALVYLLPLKIAVLSSVIWGLLLLVLISYTIAKGRGVNPYGAIFEHISIAVLIIAASNFIGKLVIGRS